MNEKSTASNYWHLLVNISSNMVQFIVVMIVTFIMAPFYLQMMGAYDYGLREMVLAIVGYMGMLDVGMRPTISRFTAVYNAQKDRESQMTVYISSMVFMGLLGTILAIFFFLWALFYPELLTPERGETETKYVLFLLIIKSGLSAEIAFSVSDISDSFLHA